MKLSVYTIFDCKSEVYNSPVFYRTDAEAIRNLSLMVNSTDNAIGLNPEDFTLFKIGSFSQENGVLQLLDAPKVSIVSAIDLKRGDGCEDKEKA